MRRLLPHIVALGAICLLVVVSALVWLERSQRFPMLQPGSYSGVIEGVFLSDGLETHQSARIYAERLKGSDEIFFLVLRVGWQPVHSVASVRENREDGKQWLLPLNISGPDGRFKLTGSSVGPSRYEGVVVNLDHGMGGRWSLAPITSSSKQRLGMEPKELQLWMQLKREHDLINQKIDFLQAKLPEQQREIEKMTRVLNEGVTLKSKANEKFEEAERELPGVQAELQAKRTELAKLNASFELSQRVIPMGKLVSLARESLARDWRWVNSYLESGESENDQQLAVAYERALNIQNLKNEINIERSKITKIRTTLANKGKGQNFRERSYKDDAPGRDPSRPREPPPDKSWIRSLWEKSWF